MTVPKPYRGRLTSRPCPEEVVGEELARSLIEAATVLSKGANTTEREIELWIEQCGTGMEDTRHEVCVDPLAASNAR